MGILLGLLPLVTIGVWVVYLHARQLRQVGPSFPKISEAIMQAVVLGGGWFVVGTELLSVFSAICFWTILLWWLLPLLWAVGAIVRHRQVVSFGWLRRDPFSAGEWVVFIALSLAMLAALLTALLYPPATYDVLTYHLPRQVMWMQQGNVEHFPTFNLRQLIMPPMAEFMGLHLMVLSHSDRLHNAIQWVDLLICFVPMALLTARLGGNRSAAMLACLLLAVCPIVFLQASNTKNDIVVAMWILIAIEWTIAAIDSPPSPYKAMLLGIAIGCAALTKGTGQIFVLPVVVMLIVLTIRRFGWRWASALVMAGVVSLCLNVPHFSRNYRMFGNISGPDFAHGGYELYNTSFTPRAILSNVVRNLACQSGTPSKATNDEIYKAVSWLHENVLKIDLNDANTTGRYSAKFRIIYDPFDEARAGAPYHFVLLLTLPLMMFLARRRMNIKLSMLLIALAGTSFFIFCAAIKWQEFHNRYFVAPGAIISPVIATAWVICLPKLVSVEAVLLLASLWPTLAEHRKPYWRSLDRLFTDSDMNQMNRFVQRTDEFMKIDKYARTHPAGVVALTGTGDSPDYLYQRIFLKRNRWKTKFFYIHAPWDGKKPIPRADVIIAGPGMAGHFHEESNTDYVPVISNSMFTMLVPLTDKVPADHRAFGDLIDVSGLGRLGGPYPHMNLPVVRWGLFPETRMKIFADKAGPQVLRLVMRRNNRERQRITILLNGRQICESSMPYMAFMTVRLPVNLEAGYNDLVFKYTRPDTGPSPQFSVLFREMQLLPIESTTTQPAP